MSTARTNPGQDRRKVGVTKVKTFFFPTEHIIRSDTEKSKHIDVIRVAGIE